MAGKNPAEKYELSKKQIEDIDSSFKLFDQDANGLITPDELSFMLRIIGVPADEEFAKSMITDVDTKEKGGVDYEDFTDMMAKKFQDLRTEEDEFNNAFDFFDKEDSGLISLEELKNVLTSIHVELTEAHIDHVMTMEDIDCHGILDFTAFTRILRRI